MDPHEDWPLDRILYYFWNPNQKGIPDNRAQRPIRLCTASSFSLLLFHDRRKDSATSTFPKGSTRRFGIATRNSSDRRSRIPRRISSLHRVHTPTTHPSTPSALMSRSFTGCTRCKARRQKCDEQRPVCGRCQSAGVQCKYAMQLQWGGRAFSRSRFGACVDTGNMQRLGMLGKGYYERLIC